MTMQEIEQKPSKRSFLIQSQEGHHGFFETQLKPWESQILLDHK